MVQDAQEMGREMKGTRRGDKRWETKGCQKVTNGGEGDGQRKEKRKKSYYFIWAANDASESFGLT